MLLGASWLSVDDTFDLRLCRHPSKPTQPLRPCEGASVDVLSKEAEHGKKRTRKAGRLFFIKKELMLAIYSTTHGPCSNSCCAGIASRYWCDAMMPNAVLRAALPAARLDLLTQQGR